MSLSAHADERDELEALRIAALDRLSESAWRAKSFCESISKESGKMAEQELDRARRELEDAERHLRAMRDYEHGYEEALARTRR